MNIFGVNVTPEQRQAAKGGKQAEDDGDGQKAGRFLGSLRDALAAASRNDAGNVTAPPVEAGSPSPASPAEHSAADPVPAAVTPPPSRAAAGPSSVSDNSALPAAEEVTQHLDRVRASQTARPQPARTELVRGRNPVPRGDFRQDPVVGWLVVVGGAGLGSFRPIFEGNNSIGRARTQRIPVDFGDEAISNEEQAYIRYDGIDRTFLFVPNMSKTNVVSVNNKKPTSAVALNPMDVITMGRTQLAFVPFCGPEFDWSEI